MSGLSIPHLAEMGEIRGSMSEAPLINKQTVERVIGQTRLRRLLRAGWLAPAQPLNGSGRRQPILFSPRDLHRALSRLEQSAVPPDKIEVARVRDSEARHGRAYVRKTVDPPSPDQCSLEEVLSSIDFSAYVDL
jgi:hypothetical protein